MHPLSPPHLSRRSVLAGALALSACSAPAAPKSGSRIRFATDWRAQAEHGGFYQAKARGYYDEAGLDVALIQGGPSVNVPQLIAAGAVEMGLGSNSFIAFNLAAAKAPVVATAAWFQKDPFVLITHPRADVKDPADIRGKPVMLSDAAITSIWVWLKARYGFTDDQVRKYTFNAAPFLTDPTAIQQGYATSEPFTIEQQGKITPQVFLMADYGYPGYAALNLVQRAFLEANRAAVIAFQNATARGWKDYLTGDPAPGDALIRADNPDMTPETLAFSRAAMQKYGLVIGTAPGAPAIGDMTLARWEAFHAFAASAGAAAPGLDWQSAFSLDALPARV